MSLVRLDLDVIRVRLVARERRLASVNAARIRSVAASLPQHRSRAPQGARTSREAGSLAGEPASTTSTRHGGPSGCFIQSQ